MAELTDRMATETRFARSLSRLTTAQRQELRAKLGTPPDYSRVTKEDWQRWERERRNRLLMFLLLIGLSSAEQHAEEIEADNPIAGDLTTNARRTARNWAIRRSEVLASEQVRRSREALDRLAAQWRNVPDVPAELVDADLVDAMGPRRDATTAATETTAGNSAGVNGAITAARKAGVRMVRRWYTRADDRVCPVCGPLHKKIDDLWETVLRNVVAPGGSRAIQEIVENGGPPAHANCRCWVELMPLERARRVRTGEMREATDTQTRFSTR